MLDDDSLYLSPMSASAFIIEDEDYYAKKWGKSWLNEWLEERGIDVVQLRASVEY